MRYRLLAILTGFLLDCILGDPHWLPHIVRLMGNTISWIEKILYNISKKKLAGFLLVAVMAVLYGVCPFVLLNMLYSKYAIAAFVIESILIYQLIAPKSLFVESMKVYSKMKSGDIEGARSAVSMIVGRDTGVLSGDGIIRAAVETVAENTSDGVIAPMLFIVIGGAPLGMLYKAINTMDSMVGYKNEKYIDFGFCAAKLDDIVNWFPARLSALLMVAAAGLCGLNIKGAIKIFRRDRYNHASPNSAQTESVCAGALNVRLAGDAYYFGKLYKKPYIGDDIRPVEDEDIKRANKMMYVSTVLGLLVMLSLRYGFEMLF